MPKLPRISGAQAVRALEKLGFVKARRSAFALEQPHLGEPGQLTRVGAGRQARATRDFAAVHGFFVAQQQQAVHTAPVRGKQQRGQSLMH